MNQERVIETRMNGSVMVRLCGAKKRDGGSCCAPAMANGRCRLHGGNAVSGAVSGTFKHGRYSKALPKGLYEDVERIMTDGDLLALRDDIALNVGRISQLLTGLTDAETPVGFWEAMGGHAEALHQAIEAQDRVALTGVLLAMQSRVGDRQIWREIRDTQQVQAKLADTERKRMRDENAFITKANFLASVMTIIQVVVEEAGREVAKRVGQRLTMMFAMNPGHAAVSEHARDMLSRNTGKPFPSAEEEEGEE